MIQIPAGARVVVAAQPVDFRKGAHGLAALASGVLAEDPFSGAVIVFRAKRADRVKILLWDTSGLVLIWKQLQQGSFRWPPIVNGVMKLSPVECKRCAGTLSGSGVRFGFPAPGHEFVDTLLRPAVDETCQQLGHVGQRIDAVELAGLDQ